MDRDPGSAIPLSPAEAVPPWAPSTVRLTGLIGLALIVAACIIGLVSLGLGESSPDVLDGLRVVLVFAGSVFVGAAISMRPELWWTWAGGSVAGFLAVFGLPSSWDSFQLFFTVAAVVAASGSALCMLSNLWRLVLVSALLLFHFIGIFMMTTSPPTEPWLSDQLGRRVFNPYLQFVYMRNAYHFYSPEPGPASVLAYFLKTENGRDPVTQKRRYKTQWFVSPTRPANIRDPLCLSYYRMLSLNEHTASGSTFPLATVSPEQFEHAKKQFRRMYNASAFPFHPVEPLALQYRLPSQLVTRYLLPSYSSHVILENTPDKETAARTTVKVYRLEHRNLVAEQMGTGQDPYHPGSYRPYFLGEFDVFGKMVNPQEPMLYWMLPIVPRKPPPGDANKKDYFDYLSMHALELDKIDDVLQMNEADGEAFNWRKLR